MGEQAAVELPQRAAVDLLAPNTSTLYCVGSQGAAPTLLPCIPRCHCKVLDVARTYSCTALCLPFSCSQTSRASGRLSFCLAASRGGKVRMVIRSLALTLLAGSGTSCRLASLLVTARLRIKQRFTRVEVMLCPSCVFRLAGIWEAVLRSHCIKDWATVCTDIEPHTAHLQQISNV